jgi:hypothetical protein
MADDWRERALKAEAALEDARDAIAEAARQRLNAENGLRDVLEMINQIISLTIQKNPAVAIAANVIREYVVKVLAEGLPKEKDDE